MEHKQFPALTTGLDEDQGIVESIFAVMGNIDGGDDVIHNGAFSKTFAERGLRVKVLDHHNTNSVMAAIGKPLELRELSRGELPAELLARYPEATGGAYAKTQMLMNTPEGKGAFIRLKEGVIDEWSFGYDVMDSDFSQMQKDGKPCTVRNLRQLRLHEISPVIFGMNSATTTLGAKADVEPDPTEGPVEPQEKAEPEHVEAKAGRAISAANQKRINGAINAVETALDGLREMLSQYMDTAPEDESGRDGKADENEAGPESPPTDDKAAFELETQELLTELKFMEVQNA